jgi:hybrid cluster-associated redox disulfide protein
MTKKTKKSNRKITKDMNFVEILEKNPDAFEILFRKGMHCIGCGMAGSETLEEGALIHGLDPDKLVSEINKTNKKVKKNKSKKERK